MRVGGLGITNGTQSLSLPTAPGTKIVKVWVENAGTVARFLSPSLALLLCDGGRWVPSATNLATEAARRNSEIPRWRGHARLSLR